MIIVWPYPWLTVSGLILAVLRSPGRGGDLAVTSDRGENSGPFGRQLGKGHSVDASEDESPQIGAVIDFGRVAGAVAAAVRAQGEGLIAMVVERF